MPLAVSVLPSDLARTRGGGERYAFELHAAVLAELGPEWDSLALVGASERPGELVPAGWTALGGAAAGERESSDCLTARDVLDAIPRGAELVISHQWRTRGTAALRMRRARRRIGALVGIDYGGGSVAGYRLARLPLPIADVGAHISEFEETLSPVRAHRDVVVRGGTDPAVFAPPAVEAREVDFLMVGRFLPHKGQRDFLEALPDGASALLIGPSDTDDRPYLEDVQRLAAARDVEIRFDASDDELVDAYRRARFTAQVPRFLVHRKGAAPPELLGLTMLEAMACGSVPVAPGSGPTAEFVRAGETGVPYDPYADGALAAALREAVSSDERRLALQRGALDESRRWTWPAAARALLDTLP